MGPGHGPQNQQGIQGQGNLPQGPDQRIDIGGNLTGKLGQLPCQEDQQQNGWHRQQKTDEHGLKGRQEISRRRLSRAQAAFFQGLVQPPPAPQVEQHQEQQQQGGKRVQQLPGESLPHLPPGTNIGKLIEFTRYLLEVRQAHDGRVAHPQQMTREKLVVGNELVQRPAHQHAVFTEHPEIGFIRGDEPRQQRLLALHQVLQGFVQHILFFLA